MTEIAGGSGDNFNKGGDSPSFLASLFTKLAFVKHVADVTGKSTEGAEREVTRQIGQVSRTQGGDIISGRGVTKSGSDD